MQLPKVALCSAILFTTLTSLASCAAPASSYPNSITISYEFVHDTSSVKPLATIFYDPKTLKSTVSSWSPPSADSQSTTPEPTSPQLLRILLPSGSSTLTSLATFNNSLTQTISLHLSPNNDATIFSASVSATVPLAPAAPPSSSANSKSKSASKSKAQQAAAAEDLAKVQVELIPPTPGPVPKLNSRRPPVVGADGREAAAEEVPEKSFFQKYWWAFILISIVAMAGSGGDK